MRTVVTTLLKPDRPTEPAAWSDRAPPPDRPTEPAAWSDHAPPPDRPTEPAASSDRASPPDRPTEPAASSDRAKRKRRRLPRIKKESQLARICLSGKFSFLKRSYSNMFFGAVSESWIHFAVAPLSGKQNPNALPQTAGPRQPTSVDRTDLFSTMRGKGGWLYRVNTLYGC